MAELRPTPPRNTRKIREALDLVIIPGTVSELRALGTAHGVVSGYFDNLDDLAAAADRLSGKATGVYVTLNPVTPALLARRKNRVQNYVKQTTSDADVVRLLWLLVDLDPKRPSGISATDTEHEAAMLRAIRVRWWLEDHGWPEGVITDSGNGAHLLYAIDLPNDPNSTKLLTRCLEALGFLFSDNDVVVDASTAKAAQLWKLPGTLACKGDDLDERPHRRAVLLEAPATRSVVPPQRLESLARILPSAPERAPARAGEALDVDGWLARHGLIAASTGEWKTGKKWVLTRCPWNPEHTDRAAYVVQFPSGAIATGCHHNSCSDKDWASLRDLVEPNWRRDRSFDEPGPVASAVIVRLADVVAEPIRWLWLNRIVRGKVNLIVGDPGLGKSTLALFIASRVTTGTDWPDGPRAPRGHVVILTAEDGIADTVRPRVDALEGDPVEITILQAVREDGRERAFNLSRDVEALEHVVAETHARLVIIDPLSAYLGKSDSFKDAEIRGVLAPLAALAEKTGAAIIAIMHLTKNSQRAALYRPQGSIAFVAAARSVFAVTKAPDDPERRLFISLKLNIAAPPPALAFRPHQGGLIWEQDPVRDMDVEAILRGNAESDEPGKLDEAKEFLQELLADGPLSVQDIFRGAQAHGISQRTLRRAKDALGVAAVRRGKPGEPGGRWLWSLPRHSRPERGPE
jgi:hypothetical protein